MTLAKASFVSYCVLSVTGPSFFASHSFYGIMGITVWHAYVMSNLSRIYKLILQQ